MSLILHMKKSSLEHLFSVFEVSLYLVIERKAYLLLHTIMTCIYVFLFVCLAKIIHLFK